MIERAKRWTDLFYFCCRCFSSGVACAILNIAGIPICFIPVILTNNKNVQSSTILIAVPIWVPKSSATVPVVRWIRLPLPNKISIPSPDRYDGRKLDVFEFLENRKQTAVFRRQTAAELLPYRLRLLQTAVCCLPSLLPSLSSFFFPVLRYTGRHDRLDTTV